MRNVFLAIRRKRFIVARSSAKGHYHHFAIFRLIPCRSRSESKHLAAKQEGSRRGAEKLTPAGGDCGYQIFRTCVVEPSVKHGARSHQKAINHVASHVCQAKIPALKTVSELRVIHAHLMQNRGVE